MVKLSVNCSMFFEDWISTDFTSLAGVVVSVVFVYAGVITYCRLTGLRSFSKMSSTDFAMTIAVGSLFAATISAPDPTVFLGLFTIGLLFFAQWLISRVRKKTKLASCLIDNQPILLMRGSEMLKENMVKTSVTHNDILGKLREANVLNFNQVKAVVFEATGDISVLHSSENEDVELSSAILEDVVGWDEAK